METELFMECEEEELEPWQQVDDSVEEEDVDFTDHCEPVEDSPSSSPAPESPPPKIPPPVVTAKAAPSPLQIISSVLRPIAPSIAVPARTTSAPPLMAQGPPLILTQTAGGTFLVPARTGATQPIFLTTQGFQVPAVMNTGTSLVLNLRPGQRVQPLTLIQSPSIGQLVRPNLGVSPVLPQEQVRPARSGGLAQLPVSSFMQLPTTLSLRTSTAGSVNLQVTQVGGAKSINLTGCPALPSGSAIGSSPVLTLASSTTPRPAPAASATGTEAPRVVMTVEEFYYGIHEGDPNLRKTERRILLFSCSVCSYRAENNVRFMQHMLQHSELTQENKDVPICRCCYRQLSTSAQLQIHQDQVHGLDSTSCMCRICEWGFENEVIFLNHMKSNHKPGEMPYVCQVCLYRSSFYSDVLHHFASFHIDSRFLLCVFCLKVTRNPVTYQQHLLRHQLNPAFHCYRCRLQFTCQKDKMQHKLVNHRSFSRPAKLQGLPPGSKVTVRTYGKLKPGAMSAGGQLLQRSTTIIQPIKIKTDPEKLLQARNRSERPASRRVRTHPGDVHRLMCMECGTDASNISAHYPTHVHCLLCAYRSCCSRAYATHMIRQHIPRSKQKLLPQKQTPPPCAFLLRCARCAYWPQSGDLMAEHLIKNPDHQSAICWKKSFVEPDIQFSSETPEQKEPEQTQDPAWKSAESWKDPSESSEPVSPIRAFTEPSGPYHSLSKNCDAIDYFNLMFPPALVDLITRETNAHARASISLGSPLSGWVPVTAQEVKGFLGLVILMGIHNLPDPSSYWSWNHFDNSYTFYRAMTFKRFQQIAENLRMGSFVTNAYCGTSNHSDALHIFRPMLEHLGGAMWSCYHPNGCLSVDRALLGSLDGDGLGNQPQLWLLCDSKSGYCHRFLVQLEQKVPDPGFRVVPELVKGLEGKHHQLFLASSITSIPLVLKLLEQDVYASSSFSPLSPILPHGVWEDGQLEKPGDFLQRRFGPLLVTRWKDTKEMGCLSTNAASGEVDTVWRRSQTRAGELDPMSRPLAFRLLQENMRGVDICKQLLACNPLGGVPQDRHWRKIFWFLVNLSVVNAFIMLRESRKENPPAWVQDGLFSQVNFRRRLGHQLAKCAQKQSEVVDAVECRGEPVKHRLARLSSASKRCKNCKTKSIRRESVYGCTVCKANLCKTGCFWEFHGLSPLTKGSPKAGFLKDRISGAVELVKVPEREHDDLGPLENFESSDEEQADEPETPTEKTIPEEECSPAGSPVAEEEEDETELPATWSCEGNKDSQQLRISLMALCDGLHQTSRVFSTKPGLIRSWLRDAARRRADLRQGGAGEARLLRWVLSMREQQLSITENSLLLKLSSLKKKGAFCSSFQFSHKWAVDFLLEHRLGVRARATMPSLAYVLPSLLEDEVQTFREFTKKVFQVHQLEESSVCCMDKLHLYLDLKLAQHQKHRSRALQLTGPVPIVTVYLTVLPNGNMLPSLVLTSKLPPTTTQPDFVLLQSFPKGMSLEDCLEIWTSGVWLQYLSSRDQPRKSMLILDKHREHLGANFLSSLSESHCLPAIIPAGCSFCLHPLAMALKPALQNFLLSRWSQFSTGNPPELMKTSPWELQTSITQLLVDWILEALEQLQKVPNLLRRSFHLTGILPASNQTSKQASNNTTDQASNEPSKQEFNETSDESPNQTSTQSCSSGTTNLISGETSADKVTETPADVQLELLKNLTEILLGTEAAEINFDVLEMEEETEEEDQPESDAEDEQMEVDENGTEMEEDRKVTEDDGERAPKETEERRVVDDGTSEEDWKEGQKEGTIEGFRGAEGMETKDRTEEEDMGEEFGHMEDEREKTNEEKEEERKTVTETKETEEEKKEERREADRARKDEEEGEIEEDRKSTERRETRIEIGEEVGDEWKMTVTSQTEEES